MSGHVSQKAFWKKYKEHMLANPDKKRKLMKFSHLRRKIGQNKKSIAQDNARTSKDIVTMHEFRNLAKVNPERARKADVQGYDTKGGKCSLRDKYANKIQASIKQKNKQALKSMKFVTTRPKKKQKIGSKSDKLQPLAPPRHMPHQVSRVKTNAHHIHAHEHHKIISRKAPSSIIRRPNVSKNNNPLSNIIAKTSAQRHVPIIHNVAPAAVPPAKKAPRRMVPQFLGAGSSDVKPLAVAPVIPKPAPVIQPKTIIQPKLRKGLRKVKPRNRKAEKYKQTRRFHLIDIAKRRFVKLKNEGLFDGHYH